MSLALEGEVGFGSRGLSAAPWDALAREAWRSGFKLAASCALLACNRPRYSARAQLVADFDLRLNFQHLA